MGAPSPSLLLISPGDNVKIAVRALQAGEPLDVAGGPVPLQQPVNLGHKIAARDIAPGEKIIKYGVPIGSATMAIRAGEVVHLHNMKSDYLPTYLRGTSLEGNHGH